MQNTVEGLEKERDFYFGKLRDIEVLCQQPENEGLAVLQDVIKILYATEEGFEVPEDAEGGDELPDRDRALDDVERAQHQKLLP